MKRKSGKIMTKLCAAATAAGILLGALPGTPVFAEEAGDAAMGRYVETDVTLPENFIIENTVRTAEGNLRIIGINEESSEYQMYDSSDGGETWEVSGALQEFSSEENYLATVVLSPDGGGAGITYHSEKEDPMNGTWAMVIFDQEGNVNEAELPDGVNGVLPAFSVQGELFGNSYDVGVMSFDRSTGQVKDTITTDFGNTFGICGNEALLLKDDQLQLYDLSSGDPLERDEALEAALYGEGTDSDSYNIYTSMGSVIILTEDEDGKLFYCTRDGIFSHTMGGSVVEKVVDGSLTSLSDPNGVFGALVVLGQDFYVQYTGGEGENGLHKYIYDETVPTVPQHELTVYSLRENSAIQQAVVLFQKEYPDTYVNYVTGMSGEDGVTASDALRTLNTDILAGNGPDVLLLDDMSVETYAEKGVLADLSGILQEVADTDGVLENIAKTYQEGDVIPAVPAKFSMETVAGNPELLKNINGLKDLTELASQQDALEPFTVKNLPEILYPVCAGAWKNEDGTIDQEKLTEFVSAVKEIDDIYRANLSEKMQQMMADYDEGIYTSLEDLNMENDVLAMAPLSLMSGEAQVEIGTLGEPTSYCGLDTVNRETGNVDVALLNGQLSNVFLPSCILSVLNTAKEQERAMDFVKYLLSANMQSQIINGGFSVNRKSFEEALYTSPFKDGEGWTMSASDMGDNYVELQYVWPEKESLDKLAALVEQLDTRADIERVQRDVVLEETRRCMSGEIGIDEAVNSIMQKINLYLAE